MNQSPTITDWIAAARPVAVAYLATDRHWRNAGIRTAAVLDGAA